MVTLTHTLFDIADCNTTMYYLGSASSGNPLPFSSADDYDNLYEELALTAVKYGELCGHPGVALDQLRAVYSRNKYWQYYLSSRDIGSYPKRAWESFVPIAATLKEKIEIVLPLGLDLDVSPIPRVLLSPFGWSVWISFRIVGHHGLDDLARLIRHLAGGKAYRLQSKPATLLTVTQYFEEIGKGVREDAFGGRTTRVDIPPQDSIRVTSVIAKHGGSPSLGAMTAEHELALKQIVRPTGALSLRPVTDLADPLPYGQDELLDFVVHDHMSWFIWAEHLLQPMERNAQDLRCYHKNTFLSLLQAWSLQHFLARAVATKPWSPVLTELVESASALLEEPAYKNFSLLSFLDRADFVRIRAAVEKRLGGRET